MPQLPQLPWKRRQAPPARVLTASGVKITSSSSGRNIRALAGSRQGWQSDAWAYRDMIGEVRFGTEFLAHAVASCGWHVAQVNNSDVTDDGDTAEPIPFDSDDCTLTETEKREAAEELARLPLHAGSPFMERMVINLAVPGECYLHSFEGHTGMEEWAVRSINELSVVYPNGEQEAPVMTLHEGPGLTRTIDPTQEDVLRLWKPHADRAWLADSAMRSLLDVCEDVVLAGREQRAASRSRVASNGVLLVPRGMTLTSTRRQEDGTEVSEQLDASSSRFVQTLTEAMINPISNEGHAGAVMPVMLIGDPEDLEKFRHVAFVRETSAEVGEKVTRGLQRIATGLDIPAEVVTGMSEANHWSAWMIDAATAKYHVGPWCRTVADCLTMGFLRASLMDRGWRPERAAMVQTWYDLGPVTENPNRRDDAKDAWERNLISDAAARRDLGYSEQDAPDDQEVLRRIAVKTGLQSAEVPELLNALMKLRGKVAQVITDQVEEQVATPPAQQLPPGGQGGSSPRSAPDGANARGGGAPNDGTPRGDRAPQGAAAGEHGPVTMNYALPDGSGEARIYADGHAEVIPARAGDRLAITQRASLGLEDPATALTPEDSPTDGWVIDPERCHRMARVEMALVDRVLAAADPIISRAVERAAGRARNQVRSVRGDHGDRLRESLADASTETYLATLGQEQAMSLGLDTQALLRDAWAPLESRWATWVQQAVDDEVRAALQVLDPSPNAWVPLATPQRVTPKRKATTQGQRRANRKAKAVRNAARTSQRMKARTEQSWAVLQDRLNSAAERQLYRPGTAEVPDAGERPATLLAPGDVYDALDVIGGGEPGAGDGITHGPDLAELMAQEGARQAGREWLYGLSPRNTFQPHMALDGTRFRDWSDGALSTALEPRGIQQLCGPHFHPGDHRGCLCRSASLWSVQADPDEFTDPDALRAREIDDALRKLYGITDGGVTT